MLRFRAKLQRQNSKQKPKEFRASSPEQLREFIEAYWTCEPLSDSDWKKLLNGGELNFIYGYTMTVKVVKPVALAPKVP